MPVEPLNSTEIQAGKPTKQELFSKLKNSIDDLAARLTIAEATGGTFPPIEFDFHGVMDAGVVQEGILKYRVPIQMQILAVRVQVYVAGSSGSLEIDLKKQTGAGIPASIISSPISVDSADGDDALESGTVTAGLLTVGDILMVDVNAIQTGMEDFTVFVEYEGA